MTSQLDNTVADTVLPIVEEAEKISFPKAISSDSVVNFLEKRSPLFEFEYSHIKHDDLDLSPGYEVKTVDKIESIYLMINPDPRNLARVPPNSLVVSHHKIAVYNNRVYQAMLEQARTNQFNIYNFHLAWDVMEHGIGDSFLYHLGFTRKDFSKVDLTYKGHKIPGLGAIMKKEYPLETIISRLQKMNVKPSAIVNMQCKKAKVGYIPGGGFVDTMITEMADKGVGILISSDHNWVVETLARELGITLVEIDHYVSEKYGLQTMRKILDTAFPSIPVDILDNMDSLECALNDCSCCCRGLRSFHNQISYKNLIPAIK